MSWIKYFCNRTKTLCHVEPSHAKSLSVDSDSLGYGCVSVLQRITLMYLFTLQLGLIVFFFFYFISPLPLFYHRQRGKKRFAKGAVAFSFHFHPQSCDLSASSQLNSHKIIRENMRACSVS